MTITTSSERDLETYSKNARPSLRGRGDKVSRILDRRHRAFDRLPNEITTLDSLRLSIN